MYKTPEQIAEDYFPINRNKRRGFIAGYQSRDSEIEKLVEVLGKIIEVSKRPSVREAIVIKRAKEALKPYEK